jgi:Trk-type K+ transport system membrane component
MLCIVFERLQVGMSASSFGENFYKIEHMFVNINLKQVLTYWKMTSIRMGWQWQKRDGKVTCIMKMPKIELILQLLKPNYIHCLREIPLASNNNITCISFFQWDDILVILAQCFVLFIHSNFICCLVYLSMEWVKWSNTCSLSTINSLGFALHSNLFKHYWPWNLWSLN